MVSGCDQCSSEITLTNYQIFFIEELQKEFVICLNCVEDFKTGLIPTKSAPKFTLRSLNDTEHHEFSLFENLNICLDESDMVELKVTNENPILVFEMPFWNVGNFIARRFADYQPISWKYANRETAKAKTGMYISTMVRELSLAIEQTKTLMDNMI